MIAMTGKIRPTPAVASVPSWPTKKVSAILYSAVTSMEMMVGTASVQMSRGIASVVMRTYLLFVSCCISYYPKRFSINISSKIERVK